MKMLITGAWGDAQKYIPRLQKMGHEVRFLQWEEEALPCDASWPEGVICNGLFLFHPIEEFRNLRFIQLTSAGLDRVPMDYIRANSITIYNAKDVYSIPMAEYAICGVLMLYKRVNCFSAAQKQHHWQKQHHIPELYGKTVCILGCGSVGTECAKRFAAFGCKVIGINRTIRQDDNYDRIAGMEELDSLLPEADILVISLPLTEETRHLLNAERLACLKNSAVLVNIARGSIIDTSALIQMLQQGRLGGAVLDVFEEEPLPEDSPLWEMENVILTPHNSYAGEGNGERLSQVIFKNLEG